jgi:hypothetical protein
MSDSSGLEQERKALMAKLVDRIASDPAFRQQLVDNPQAAIQSSDLGAELEAFQQRVAESADVSGYISGRPWGNTWGVCCVSL